MKTAKHRDEIIEKLPMACADETAAVEFFENQRWEDHPTCAHCGGNDVYPMKDRATGGRNKRFLWRCKSCGKQYTVRVGTILEDSAIPMRHWALAFWRACSSKKGVSAKQIERETGLCYKTALYMMHRIRHAVTEPYSTDTLSGVVEADETYIGGKPRNIHRSPKYGPRKFIKQKTPVMAIIQRGGEARAMVLPAVTSRTLRQSIHTHVDRAANLQTDGLQKYRPIGREQTGGHAWVDHSAHEYVRGADYVNTCESFFALLKRKVYGTHHAVSPKHLKRYVGEAEFHWNTRKMSDGDRVSAAIRGGVGKRLMYREPV